MSYKSRRWPRTAYHPVLKSGNIQNKRVCFDEYVLYPYHQGPCHIEGTILARMYFYMRQIGIVSRRFGLITNDCTFIRGTSTLVIEYFNYLIIQGTKSDPLHCLVTCLDSTALLQQFPNVCSISGIFNKSKYKKKRLDVRIIPCIRQLFYVIPSAQASNTLSFLSFIQFA